MRIKRMLNIFGVFFLIIGFVFIFNSLQSFTGFTIFEGAIKTISSIIGIALISISILLFAASKDWNKYKVVLVIREYESGALNPVQSALKINNGLFPEGLEITGVNYHGDVKETIKTKNEFIPVELNNKRKAADLALALYELAVINDRANSKNCELHLSRQVSSKHHKVGLRKLIENFEDRYSKDLELAKA